MIDKIFNWLLIAALLAVVIFMVIAVGWMVQDMAYLNPCTGAC